MDDVLLVEVNQSLQSLVQGVLAESLTVVALEVFKHGSESAAVHQLHEDPKPVLEVKGLLAADNAVELTHLHDADLILDGLSLLRVLWLGELESEKLVVSDTHTTEDPCEATVTFLADHFIVLRGVLFLDVGGSVDLL